MERLCHGDATFSELASRAKMAQPSFLQHLRLLEKSGLVRSNKRGRVRSYQLKTDAFKPMEHWLDAQRRIWEKRLDQLDNYLLTLKEKHR